MLFVTQIVVLPDRQSKTQSRWRSHIKPMLVLLLWSAAFVFPFHWAGAQSSSAESARNEPLGPCSRRTPLVISEIMYHPPARSDSNNLEFVEVYNSQPWPEDISGYRVGGAVEFLFPPGTFLPGEGFVVVAAEPDSVRTHYGITNVVGPYAGRLANDAETIRLFNRSGALLLEATYDSQPPWPAAADGAGHSLVLARPSWGERSPQAWAASDRRGGSPGRAETTEAEPLRPVTFNELLAHTTEPQPDFVELHNYGSTVIDLSGCHLTDEPLTNKFTFPANTMLGARGFRSLTQTELGFALSAAGETLYLLNSNQTRVLDAVRYGPQSRDVAWGRWPDGAGPWSELATPSAGQTNRAPLRREVVINEIMSAPISGESDDEFVELYNRGTNVVNLGGWRFVAGIDFTFPSNTTLAPSGYLVVAHNAGHLMTNYPGLGPANLVGDFGGRLSGRGERLALGRPEWIVQLGNGQTVSNVEYVVVSEVTYQTGGRRSQWADGGGSSLELVDPQSDPRWPGNWADSDETAKAPWSVVEYTGRADLGTGTPNALHVFLLGAGECLLDDVEVLSTSGVNLVTNSTFASGLAPWVAQGDHELSSWQSNGGWNDSGCLHLRAEGDGDPGANKIRVPLSSAVSINAAATLRARVRWLRGHPELLLRTYGSYVEAFGRLSVPANLGTPGARNSRALTNAAPAIADVRHQPILPAAGQPVIVTARVTDSDGVASVQVRYRLDPDTNTVISLPMLDDGTGGDDLAGDGLYTATLPGQNAGVLLAFHVVAVDAHVPAATVSFPSDAPGRECLVRFGETQPSGKFGTYRVWITQATLNRWTARLKLSNAKLDATFVYGNQRAIYNAGALYAGSAYHSERYTGPTGAACDYKFLVPKDEPFLGSDELVVVWPGLTGGDPVDPTGQQEQTCYWLAGELGLPFNYQRYVNFFVNGTRRSFIMQDTQKPDGDLVSQWYPDDDAGDLFKIQIWREYDAAGASTVSSVSASLADYVSAGAKKTARYRWCWTPRGASGSLNHFDDLFALVDAVNSPTKVYTASVEAEADIEQWMRTFAAEHLVGNWDSYGYGNGQNLYSYKSAKGRWRMMIWDLDVAIGAVSDPPTSDLFKLTNPFFPNFDGDTAIVDRMYKTPRFARAYWRAVQDAVNGPMVSSNLNARLDPRTAAFAASGITVTSPDVIKTYFSSRRSYALGRLATVAAGFTVNNPTEFSTNNNLVLLSGTAPIDARDIVVNGVPFPVTWTSVTSWVASIVVSTGQTELVVQGLNSAGQPIPSMRRTNSVSYTGPAAVPEAAVAINEIHYQPVRPGSAFVELVNYGEQSVNLGQWRLNGVDFTFPAGSVLLPGQQLVLAENRGAFVAAYGTAIAVFGEFRGTLQLDGETLTLFRPGLEPGEEWVVDQVRYEGALPWPAATNGLSLQLLDPTQEHRRVSNWAARPRSPAATNVPLTTLPPFPTLWLNEVQPQNVSGPRDNAGHREPWLELYNAGPEPVSLDDCSLSDNLGNLAAWTFPAGSSIGAGEFKLVWCDNALGETTATSWHAGFRLNALAGSVYLAHSGSGTPQLLDYVNYRNVAADQSVGSIPDGQPIYRRLLITATPGSSNTNAPQQLGVVINEWAASNVSPGGLPNPAGGNYDDWFELFNPGSESASLAGYYLTDTLADPFRFQIPPGYFIPPRGYLLVWADGQPSRNATNHADLHVSFQLDRSGEAIGLFASNGQAIDTVSFGPQTNNVSQGRYPDGGQNLLFFIRPTPRGPNELSDGPIRPAFLGIERLPTGELSLTWQTLIGKTYRIEFKAALSDPAWVPLGDYVAFGDTLTIRDPVGAAQRFYRIERVD
jgi:hypothetical protein